MENKKTDRLYKGDQRKGEIEILASRVVFQNQFATLYYDQVAFPSGLQGQHLRFAWTAPSAVAILPVLSNKRIVLIQAFRHPIRQWLLEIPKGFGRSGESTGEAARRELFEEAHLRCEKLLSLGPIFPDAGILCSKEEIFLALDCKETQGPGEDREAIKEVVSYPYPEALAMAIKGEIKDALTLAALLRARSYLE